MPVRAVLDTNVLVSGLMGAKGAPRQALDAWLEGQFTLVISLYLIDEFVHVLQYPRIAERLQVTEDELVALLAALLSQAEVVPGRLQLPGVTRDPKDDAVDVVGAVACAVEGSADYIVSGDQDLLVLDHYEDVRVVTPRQFVEILQGEGC